VPQMILVVDDDPLFLRYVRHALELRCFVVHALSCGTSILGVIRSIHPDLVLLDRMLPGTDGFIICEDIRSQFPDLPVILLSTRSSSRDMIDGIYLGADDYLAKPLSPEFLVAKIHAVLRRTNRWTIEDLHRFGPYTLDAGEKRIWLDGHVLTLTKTEYMILAALIEKRGKVLDQDHIMVRILGYSPENTNGRSNISFHIRSLREKLGGHRGTLATVRGIGYRLRSLSARRLADISD